MLENRKGERDASGKLSSIEELDHDADVESHHDDDQDHESHGPTLEMTALKASAESKAESRKGDAGFEAKTDDKNSNLSELHTGESATDERPKLEKLKRCFSYKFWFTHGVSVYRDTPVTAWFLIASLLPFFIVQGVAFSRDKDITKSGAIAALVICLLFFGIYSGYQIRNDKLLSWKQKQVKKKFDAIRWVAMAKKVADNELSSSKSDAIVVRNSENYKEGVVSFSENNPQANPNTRNDAHIRWARQKLGLEEQLTAGFLKFRSQDSTSRAIKETIKTQKLHRRASKLSISKHSKNSESQWLANQRRSFLAKTNGIQPPRSLITVGSTGSIPTTSPKAGVAATTKELEASPPVRQSTIEVLVGKDILTEAKHSPADREGHKISMIWKNIKI